MEVLWEIVVPLKLNMLPSWGKKQTNKNTLNLFLTYIESMLLCFMCSELNEMFWVRKEIFFYVYYYMFQYRLTQKLFICYVECTDCIFIKHFESLLDQSRLILNFLSVFWRHFNLFLWFCSMNFCGFHRCLWCFCMLIMNLSISIWSHFGFSIVEIKCQFSVWMNGSFWCISFALTNIYKFSWFNHCGGCSCNIVYFYLIHDHQLMAFKSKFWNIFLLCWK